MEFNQSYVEEMDKKTAIAEIQKVVYEATKLIEQLEKAGKIYGNGDYIRQSISNNAKKLLKEMWL